MKRGKEKRRRMKERERCKEGRLGDGGRDEALRTSSLH